MWNFVQSFIPMNKHISIGGRITLQEDTIILLEGDTNYTHIYTRNGEKFTVATTLKKLESKLGEGHFRSHKKYIVNLLAVSSLHKNSLLLQKKRKVLVSRRRKPDLLEKLEFFNPSVL